MDRISNKWLVLAFAIPMPVVHVIMGLANLYKVTAVEPVLGAMVICVTLVAIICRTGTSSTLPLPAAWGVVVGVVVMDVLVNAVLPQGTHPGYAAWQSGAIQMLLVALTFRNRLWLAWVGMGLFAVLDFASSRSHGLSLVDALALVLTPVMWMVIATAVQLMLGRSRTNIEIFMSQSNESAGRLAREHARNLYRDQWMRDLEEKTRPALESIVSGSLDETQRRELTLLEAELRDQIRGRGLASGEVLKAGRAARMRGVKVDLLDDRKQPLPQHILDHAHQRLTDILNRATSGTVRARLLPVGEQPHVTILAFDESALKGETYVELD